MEFAIPVVPTDSILRNLSGHTLSEFGKHCIPGTQNEMISRFLNLWGNLYNTATIRKIRKNPKPMLIFTMNIWDGTDVLSAHFLCQHDLRTVFAVAHPPLSQWL
jgi:hypothetical protein